MVYGSHGAPTLSAATQETTGTALMETTRRAPCNGSPNFSGQGILSELLTDEKKYSPAVPARKISDSAIPANVERKNQPQEISQPSPLPSPLPSPELCDICEAAIRWQSIYRDGVWRCPECEPWPSRRLVGRLIILGSFDASQGGPAWIDEQGNRVASGDACEGVAANSRGSFAGQFEQLTLFTRIDRDGVIHRSWVLPNFRRVLFTGWDDRTPRAAAGLVGVKFPPIATEIPDDKICARKKR
jgi:hypothetical protein